MNDIASENHEVSEQAMVKKDLLEKKVCLSAFKIEGINNLSQNANELQWNLRNQRLDFVGNQVVKVFNARMDKVMELFCFVQSLNATLELATKRYKLPAGICFNIIIIIIIRFNVLMRA